uniref:Uncharacterized protein n=1 Tax=Penaeus monodon majanivirus A TaxID=2984271 RepID=A0A9C7CE10_9VIRU|nr:MAG: hypothetical protein [Penaeus monodon majanivirus A]
MSSKACRSFFFFDVKISTIIPAQHSRSVQFLSALAFCGSTSFQQQNTISRANETFTRHLEHDGDFLDRLFFDIKISTIRPAQHSRSLSGSVQILLSHYHFFFCMNKTMFYFVSVYSIL